MSCGRGHQCYCRPCVKAYQVDVIQYENGRYTVNEGGCDKMSVCATTGQRDVATFLVFDNLERDKAKFTAKMHVGQESRPLEVRHATATNMSYAYEFNFSHDQVGIGVLEVFVNDEQIPESPFRVEVVPRNCEADYPGQNKVAVSVEAHRRSSFFPHALTSSCSVLLLFRTPSEYIWRLPVRLWTCRNKW